MLQHYRRSKDVRCACPKQEITCFVHCLHDCVWTAVAVLVLAVHFCTCSSQRPVVTSESIARTHLGLHRLVTHGVMLVIRHFLRWKTPA